MTEHIKVWVVDDGDQLLGWIDRDSLSATTPLRQALVQGYTDEFAVTNSATLREALSRMLGQGFRNLPVVDDRNHLLGEVTLGDVEAATADVENNHA